MEQILSNILGELQKLNGRIDNIENRFYNIENRFYNIENRFENLESRFDNLESRFENLESRFDKFEQRIDKFEQRVEERLDIIEGRLDEHYQILMALEHRSEENSAHIASLSENMNYIKKDIATINKRLDHHLHRIAKNEEEIALLKASNN